MKKQKNMKNRDLYETLRIQAEIEVFTNRAQEKLKKTRKTGVRQVGILEVLDRLWAIKNIEKVRFFEK